MLGLEFGGGGDFHSRGGLLSERGGGVGSAALTGPVLTRAVAARWGGSDIRPHNQPAAIPIANPTKTAAA